MATKTNKNQNVQTPFDPSLLIPGGNVPLDKPDVAADTPDVAPVNTATGGVADASGVPDMLKNIVAQGTADAGTGATLPELAPNGERAFGPGTSPAARKAVGPINGDFSAESPNPGEPYQPLSLLNKIGVALKNAAPGFENLAAQYGSDRDRDFYIKQHEMAQEAPVRAAQAEEAQAQAAGHRASTQMMQTSVPVDIPGYGRVYAPQTALKDIFGKIIAGQSGVAKQAEANKGKRYVTVPNVGLVDTQAPGGPKVASGTSPVGVTITPDIAHDYNIPDQLIGKFLPLPMFSQAERGGAMQWSPVMGAQGPAMAHRGADGKTVPLGLGSPSVAAVTASKELTPFTGINEEGQLVPTNAATAAREGIPSAASFQQLYGPTGNIKSRAITAETLQSHIPQMLQEISALDKAGKLGPIQGRLQDFLNGRVGKGTEFNPLRHDLMMFQTGMMNGHVGASGGSDLMRHFEEIWNAHQDANALTSGLGAANQWLEGYKNMRNLNPEGRIAPAQTTGGKGNGVNTVHQKITGDQTTPAGDQNATGTLVNPKEFRYSVNGPKGTIYSNDGKSWVDAHRKPVK